MISRLGLTGPRIFGSGLLPPAAAPPPAADLAERATVSAVKRFKCVPGPQDPPEAPYLLVWYVGAPEAISEEAVDPATRERLRALGYEW